jgi:hypothetical protein
MTRTIYVIGSMVTHKSGISSPLPRFGYRPNGEFLRIDKVMTLAVLAGRPLPARRPQQGFEKQRYATGSAEGRAGCWNGEPLPHLPEQRRCRNERALSRCVPPCGGGGWDGVRMTVGAASALRLIRPTCLRLTARGRDGYTRTGAPVKFKWCPGAAAGRGRSGSAGLLKTATHAIRSRSRYWWRSLVVALGI